MGGDVVSMRDSQNDPLCVDIDPHIKLEFHSSTVTSDAVLEGEIVATVPSSGYARLLKSLPRFQGAFIWERSGKHTQPIVDRLPRRSTTAVVGSVNERF